MKKIISLCLICSLMFAYGCASKAANGAGIGALAGGAAGALLTKNKLLGAAIGAGGGALLGWMVGATMDIYDLKAAQATLESKPTGSVTQWTNPNTGNSYQAIPQQPRQDMQNGYVYRDMVITSNTGEQIIVKGVRNPDGTWSLANNQQNSTLYRTPGMAMAYLN